MKLLSVLLIFICLFFGIFMIDNTLPWSGDNTQILHQTAAALEGSVSEFLQHYDYIVNMSDNPVAMKAYSWGTSFILIPVYKLFHFSSMAAYKIVLFMFYAAFICLLFLYFARRLKTFYAFLITLFFAVSNIFLMYSNDIMKDYPFLFGVIFSVYILEKMFDNAGGLKKTAFYSLMLAAGLFSCLEFRENGASILFILLISAVLQMLKQVQHDDLDVREGLAANKKLPAGLLYFSPFIVSAGAFFLLNIKYPVFYQTFFDFSFTSMKNMLVYYLHEIYNELFVLNIVFNYKFVSVFFAAVLSILFLYGVLKKWRQEYTALLFVLMLFSFCTFTSVQGIRYILFIIPFIFLFIGLGIQEISDKYLRISALSVFAAFILLSAAYSFKCADFTRLHFKESGCGALSPDSVSLYEYIKNNTDDSAVIISSHPRNILLFADRDSFQADISPEKYAAADYQVSSTGEDKAGDTTFAFSWFNLEERTYMKDLQVYLNPVYKNDTYTLYRIEK